MNVKKKSELVFVYVKDVTSSQTNKYLNVKIFFFNIPIIVMNGTPSYDTHAPEFMPHYNDHRHLV
jgi:hypothetical protein